MIKYHFTEATPLIEFVKKNEQRVVGKTLVSLCVPFWLEKGRYSMSDEPIILEMADYCIVVSYFLTSDLIIEIGTKEELQSNDNLNSVLRIKDDTEDYYQEEFELGENKEDIEGHKITEIRIERFSSEFEYNLAGDTRPEGGDYFSTIRIYLDRALK